MPEVFEPAHQPRLRVLRGEPTAAELAAVIVVVGASASRARPAMRRTREPSQWAARNRMVRQPVAAGPGAWRASALPR